MEEREYNGVVYVRSAPGEPWQRRGAAPAQQGSTAPQVVLAAPPPAPPAAPTRTPAGGATEGLKAGHMWVDANDPSKGQVKIPTVSTPEAANTRERLQQIKASISAVHEARKLAGKSLAVGSWSEFLADTPGVNQNRRNIDAALENASAALVQDKIKELAEVNQGGVSGMANTATEANRMAASIANLTANQDYEPLLQQLERAEQYYLRQVAMLQGKPEPDDQTLSEFLPPERLIELQATKPEQTQLSSDGTTLVEIPDWYQQAHMRYLTENRDNFDASQYAAFRSNLDERAGLTPNLQAYTTAGQNFRQFFDEGGQPQQLGVVPPAREDVSALRQGVSDFAQTPGGAAAGSFANSMTAGLVPALTGQQENMEAIQQNQPGASFVGDMAGGIAGTALLGGGSALLGARGAFANPMLQDAAFGAVSGAAQAEDPLVGGAIGLASSLGGEFLGRQVGRALPGTFAPGSVQSARESVPSSGELGIEADRLYTRAMSQGQAASPQQVNRLIDDTDTFLRSNGLMTQQGEIIGTGPLQEANQLLRSFRDGSMGPLEAKTVREKIAEGRTAMKEGAPDNRTRMLSGDLTQQFDQFAEADGVMPGIAAAREVAQRRIIGRELERARDLGQARGDINYSQGGEDLGIRRAFGALDTAEVRGAKMYPQGVQEAIRVVSRGTPTRNAAQFLGRAAPVTGVGASAPLGLGTIAGIGTSDPATGLMVAGAVGGAGLLGRGAANQMTRNDAELAILAARGGPAFQQMMQDAQEEAAIRAGRMGAGIFGSTMPAAFRDN